MQESVGSGQCAVFSLQCEGNIVHYEVFSLLFGVYSVQFEVCI